MLPVRSIVVRRAGLLVKPRCALPILSLSTHRTLATAAASTQPPLLRESTSSSSSSSSQANSSWMSPMTVVGVLVVGATFAAMCACEGPSANESAQAKATLSVDYSAVRKEIAGLLDAEDYDDGSYGPLFVRLAWHSSGSYSKLSGDGGSNGAAIRFPPERDWGGNKGLQLAVQLLDQVKRKHPGISYGDLYTLAGVVAVEEMGGPTIPWRPGRIDYFDGKKSPGQDNRLPDASKAAPHLRDVFYRMGFDDREIVALSGAHALGRCHTDRSGFEGPWTRAPTTFSNEYYKLLINEKWTERKWSATPHPHAASHHTPSQPSSTRRARQPCVRPLCTVCRSGPRQFENSASGRDLMMLPSDVALIQDPAMKPWVEKYAADEALFFKDFASAFGKLLELGVKFDMKGDVVVTEVAQKSWWDSLFGTRGNKSGHN